jgi:hypothetical protein
MRTALNNGDGKRDNMDENARINSMLMSTDDAMVWAEEFCRLFNGKTVTMSEDENQIDAGLMVGWFANAMQVAVNQYERKILRQKENTDGSHNIFKGDDDAM